MAENAESKEEDLDDMVIGGNALISNRQTSDDS